MEFVGGLRSRDNDARGFRTEFAEIAVGGTRLDGPFAWRTGAVMDFEIE
jgi:hypothetical protein